MSLFVDERTPQEAIEDAQDLMGFDSPDEEIIFGTYNHERLVPDAERPVDLGEYEQ